MTFLAALFAGFALASWMLRDDTTRSIWARAWCVILAARMSLLLSEQLPILLAVALVLSTLFPFLLLAGALSSTEHEEPAWLLPAGLGVGLARAGLHLADLEVGTALLALAAEPPAAAAAAVIFHRHVVRHGGSPVRRLVAPALLLVAAVEVWDAVGDLGFGAAHVPWSGWVVAAVALAALLVIGTIDEARRRGANAEQRFRRLAEHSRDVIAEVRSDGRVIYMSPNLREILGYEPEDVVGRHSLEVVELFGVSAQQELPGMTGVADLEAAGTFEKTWRLRRRDGSWCWVEIHANTYATPSGELRAIGVSRDVTERVEAEQKRLELEAEMQQAKRLESLGLLAGGIAHDFNNLLVGILANAELVLEDLDPESPVRARAEEIRRAGDRASELTQQLLAYAGKADVSLESFDLEALVGELAELLRASLPNTAELRVELGEETPWIHADATQVRQVVMNLITNACDALEGQPGAVTVRTGVAQLDRTELDRCWFAEGVEAGEYAYVEVGDTGRGIEEEALGKVFDPFFSTKFKGRGLGLAAVAGIVRGHRGAIQVESEPGIDTRFRVFLPRSAAAAGDSMEEDSAPSGWHGQGTALVVDDDEMVRSAAGLMVERLGFRVLSASGGAEAVELFRKNLREIRCVLLDVTMPVMDGEETFWALREIREDVPVLFMSGHSSRDIDSRLLGKSRVGRLRKPFHRAELEQGLRGLLGESGSESAHRV